eukprot:scaffold726_cov262-Pinguiococcus_pyrenoidosus.AAC.20
MPSSIQASLGIQGAAVASSGSTANLASAPLDVAKALQMTGGTVLPMRAGESESAAPASAPPSDAAVPGEASAVPAVEPLEAHVRDGGGAGEALPMQAAKLSSPERGADVDGAPEPSASAMDLEERSAEAVGATQEAALGAASPSGAVGIAPGAVDGVANAHQVQPKSHGGSGVANAAASPVKEELSTSEGNANKGNTNEPETLRIAEHSTGSEATAEPRNPVNGGRGALTDGDEDVLKQLAAPAEASEPPDAGKRDAANHAQVVANRFEETPKGEVSTLSARPLQTSDV